MLNIRVSSAVLCLVFALIGGGLFSASAMAGTNDASAAAPEIKYISLASTGVTISPLIYGVDYTWVDAPFSTFTGVKDPWKNPSLITIPSWVASTQIPQAGLLATLNRYPGGWDGEWFDWPAYLAAINGGAPLSSAPNHMDGTKCIKKDGKDTPSCKYMDGATVPGTPPDFFLTKMEPLLPYDAPGTVARAKDITTNTGPRNASFQLPIHQVIHLADDKNTTGETQAQQNYQAVSGVTQADLDTAVEPLVQEYMQIIGRYSAASNQQVVYWEIGNEWWNQDTDLQAGLARYAYLVEKAVPVIKASYPNIKLYVTADWTTAGVQPAYNDQFIWLVEDMTIAHDLIGSDNLCENFYAQGSATYATCAKIAGETNYNDAEGNLHRLAMAWNYVDGISIHSYCGNENEKCSDLPQRVRRIMTSTGKTDIYASEWSVSNGLTTVDDGSSSFNQGDYNASQTMSAFQHMVHAGINKAAYWPVTEAVPGHDLLQGNDQISTTGYAFQLMSWLYEGEDMYATVTNAEGNRDVGASHIIAAANTLDSPGFGIFILTWGDGPETINIPLKRLRFAGGLTPVQVTYSALLTASPSNLAQPNVASLPVRIIRQKDGSLVAQVTLMPPVIGGTKSNPTYEWQIAALELQ